MKQPQLKGVKGKTTSMKLKEMRNELDKPSTANAGSCEKCLATLTVAKKNENKRRRTRTGMPKGRETTKLIAAKSEESALE
ncbi:hypothetical protein PI125_g20103 [Phytophthora idaei]|nr:hypothetical protein PI125_g20103 [Phytophthora idaei]KAG3140637.1 hypothetical protein PI126_g15899 [Phytophthora idaei]